MHLTPGRHLGLSALTALTRLALENLLDLDNDAEEPPCISRHDLPPSIKVLELAAVQVLQPGARGPGTLNPKPWDPVTL